MAKRPSPPSRPADLDTLCAAADSRHRALRANLTEVSRLLAAVAEDGPPAADVLAQFQDLATFLDRHFTKEEHILWPALAALADAARQGGPRPPLPFPTMLHPVRLMEGEHARLHERLDELRQATAGLAPPVAAAERWQRACESLAAFDAAVIEHVRFENQVLFPLAIEVEGQLS